MQALRLVNLFLVCSFVDMTRLTASAPPVLDSQLVHAIADWVTRVPDHLLVELAIGERRAQAAEMISELIVAEMTMHYPELVESGAPPLPF